MFTIKRTYLGIDLPVPTIPVDSLWQAYTFENITIQSTNTTDVLDVSGVQATITFNGDFFPLNGVSYLAPVTSDLVVTVTQNLTQGLYRFPFVNQQSLYPLAGFIPHGLLGIGLESYSKLQLTTALLVQSFVIPGISLPNSGVDNTIPTITG